MVAIFVPFYITKTQQLSLGKARCPPPHQSPIEQKMCFWVLEWSVPLNWFATCVWNLWSCSRTLTTSSRMQQVGILLTGTLDKVNTHISCLKRPSSKFACLVCSCCANWISSSASQGPRALWVSTSLICLQLSHDFAETPVSVRHSKVRPAVEKPHSPRTFIIQQPRKF